MIEDLSTYGGQATLWAPRALGAGAASLPALAAWARSPAATWWIADGYKEPFFAFLSRASDDDLVRELEARLAILAIPVVVATAPFVPHRVRVHATWQRARSLSRGPSWVRRMLARRGPSDGHEP
jgi:hypothetical protein